MAALSDADRQRVWRGLMRYWSPRHESPGTIMKTQFRAAVDATDDWQDSNAASYNTAIPQPARGELSATQKNLLFCAVSAARVGDIALLRRILGEVD